MDSKEVRQQLSKAQVMRLKALGKGIKVGQVLGPRLLVRTVSPFTKMDEVEKKGILFIPETVRDQNTPLPTTGVIVAVGELERRDRDIFAEGVMVMFPKFSGMDFTVEEEDFRILETREVLCTLEGVDEVVPVKGRSRE